MDDDTKKIIAILGALFLCSIMVMMFIKKKEIDAYNHATGKNISFSDGMWLELRIQEPAVNNQTNGKVKVVYPL